MLGGQVVQRGFGLANCRAFVSTGARADRGQGRSHGSLPASDPGKAKSPGIAGASRLKTVPPSVGAGAGSALGGTVREVFARGDQWMRCGSSEGSSTRIGSSSFGPRPQ